MVSSLLLTALLAAASPPAADDPLPAEAQARAKEALAQSRALRGAAALIRLRGLRDDLADPRPVDATFARIAADARAAPFTRTLASQVLLDIDLSQGRVAEAQRRIRALGFVQDFYVVGGFDNEGKAGCDTDFGPEPTSTSRPRYPAKGREARWRNGQRAPLDGFVDLRRDASGPPRGVVAYALHSCDEPAARRAVLGLGTSGAFRLLVNGAKVATSDAYNPARPDQARVQVQLRKGLNRVLLKVCHEDSGPLGLLPARGAARGAPGDAGWRCPTAAPLERGRRPPPAAADAHRRARGGGEARRPTTRGCAADYATCSGHPGLRRARAHGRGDAERAAADAARAGQPDAATAAARRGAPARTTTCGGGTSRRRSLRLRSCSRRAARLAQHELSQDHPERALTAARRLWCSAGRPSSPAQVLLARAPRTPAATAASRRPGASRRCRRPRWRIPVAARGRVAVARGSTASTRPGAARGVLLALRFDDVSSRALARLAARRHGRRRRGAAEQLQRALTLDPYDNGVRLRLAELLAANGRLDEGLTLLRRGRALCPRRARRVRARGPRPAATPGKQDAALASLRALAGAAAAEPGLHEGACARCRARPRAAASRTPSTSGRWSKRPDS